MPRMLMPLAIVSIACLSTGCAVRLVQDPRLPGAVKDAPVLLTVCSIEEDGYEPDQGQGQAPPPAHLSVGDQVELSNSRLGRLRIRHVPDGGRPAWNGGDDARVRSRMLVERVDPRGDKRDTRRFVPVGRFKVDVASGEHQDFDFLASKVTVATPEHPIPRCRVEVGDDEVIIRGVGDGAARHNGRAHLI